MRWCIARTCQSPFYSSLRLETPDRSWPSCVCANARPFVTRLPVVTLRKSKISLGKYAVAICNPYTAWISSVRPHRLIGCASNCQQCHRVCRVSGNPNLESEGCQIEGKMPFDNRLARERTRIVRPYHHMPYELLGTTHKLDTSYTSDEVASVKSHS